jgi:origin recognition complex subunit 5
VISEVFKSNGGYVNCVECFTPRLLFEHAMDQLIHHEPGYKNGYTSSRKILDVQQFVKCIRETFSGDIETKYLILDRAERLRDMPGTILPVLLRLSELVSEKQLIH